MAFEHIEVHPIAGSLGAEVSGVDLSQPLDDPTFKEIHDAWMEHLVLFFRDQDITPDQHKDFGRRFGELHVHPFIPGLEGHPEIIVLENDRKRRPYINRWHTDVTFDANPPMASALHAQVAPELGGDTLWANMVAAYEALSDTLQRFLSGLSAVHDFTQTFGRGLLTQEGGAERLKRTRELNPPVEHPVVRTHPVTNRKGLFVNPTFTSHIVGMRLEESENLLHFLYDHAAAPDFQCRFRWQRHSLALWDNRCTQHYALADYWPQHRLMYRVTVIGDRPV